MPAPRNDAKAQAMYALYQAGHSLEQVAAAFGVTRQSVYKMFDKRGYRLRDKPPPLPFVLFNGLRYTLRACGYYGCTTGSRDYLHRDVWRHHYGAIPRGYDVHHKDRNPSNNRIGNLELLTKSDHSRLYNTGSNQYRRVSAR